MARRPIERQLFAPMLAREHWLQPVERRLDRVVRRQVSPLITPHIAKGESVFQCSAFQFGRQRLCRPQSVILQQAVAAPRMGRLGRERQRGDYFARFMRHCRTRAKSAECSGTACGERRQSTWRGSTLSNPRTAVATPRKGNTTCLPNVGGSRRFPVRAQEYPATGP